MANEKNDNMRLEKSAQELKDDESIPTIGEDSEDSDAEIPWEQAKQKMKVAPNFVVIIPPKETDSGIVLPDGTNLLDDEEYRPIAQKVGDVTGENMTDWFDQGERLVLHPNAAEQAIPIKFMGHKLYWVHRQFVMGTEENDD